MKKLIFSCLVSVLTTQLYAQHFLVEPFDNNNNNWPFLEHGDGYSISIENGHLVMDGNTTAIHCFKQLPITAETDFAVHSRMSFIEGNHLGWMGLRFAMSDQADKYISFVYNNDKGFLIGVNNGKKYDVIRESKSLLVKPYDYNTLTVIKSGTTYKFLLNDKQVHEEKIKSFFGPMFGVITNMNMKMQVDEFQVYDPKKGKAEINDNSVLSTIELSNTTGGTFENLVNLNDDAPPEYKEFLTNFGQLPSPYYFSPETGQGVDVSQLPFTQKNFYQYVLGNVRNKAMWAVGKLGECGSGVSLLMLNRYNINNQDVSRFIIVAFNEKGEMTGQKEIGAMVKEGGSIFQILDFKTYRDGNVINAEATTTYQNGHKERTSVRFNATICNLQ